MSFPSARLSSHNALFLPSNSFILPIPSQTNLHSLCGVCPLAQQPCLLWQWPISPLVDLTLLSQTPLEAHTLHPLPLPELASRTFLFLRVLNVQPP